MECLFDQYVTQKKKNIRKNNLPLKSRLLNEFSCILEPLPDYAKATEMRQQILPTATSPYIQ
jgi:hypothetical protein